LTTAILDLLHQVQDSSDIQFTSRIDDLEGAFSKDTEITLYRILQECCSNIVRHSQATRAQIKLSRTSTAVVLEVQDNGCGFSKPDLKLAQLGKRGFGLLGIQERTEMINGSLMIESSPGQGTTITITLLTGGSHA
jgi:signal transduction histidine kinase